MSIEYIIVGAGDFGREVLQWAKQSPLKEDGTIIGFIDDNRQALGDCKIDIPIVSTIKEFQPKEHQRLIMAIAAPKAKLAVAEALQSRGAKFASLIHPTAIIGDRVTLGVGTVICPQVVISCDAFLGDFVSVNLMCTLGHDTKVGDGVTFSSQNDIAGYAQLGKGCFLGSGARVIPKVKVGDFVTIGAGSVVVRNTRSDQSVFGIPAKKI